MKYLPDADQRVAIRWLVENSAGGLFMRPGRGKTACVLTAFEILRRRNVVDRLLVIAPKRVCQTTWPEEAAKWDHLTLTVADGISQRTRMGQAHVLTLNYQRIPQFFGRPMKAPGKKKAVWKPGVFQWGATGARWMLVVDESTYIKTKMGVWNQTLMRYAQAFSRRIVMTGTPQPNGSHDLFGQMLVADRGATFGTALGKFEAEYFDEVKIPGRQFVRRTMKAGAFGRIVEAIKPRTLSITTEPEGLPPEQVIEVPVVLSPSAKAAYEAETDGTRRRQRANGILYDDPLDSGPNRGYEVVHSEKLEAAIDRIVEHGAPMLVLYEFKSEAIELRARLRARGKRVQVIGDDPQAIKNWCYRTLDVLLMHPEAGGLGLNLQAGGNTLLWFGPTWNLLHWIQANARLRRPGQAADSVVVYVLVARGTVDERVMRVLRDKNASQEALLEATS